MAKKTKKKTGSTNPAANPANPNVNPKSVRAPRKSWVVGQLDRITKAQKRVRKALDYVQAHNPPGAPKMLDMLSTALTCLASTSSLLDAVPSDYSPKKGSKLAIGDKISVKATVTATDAPILAHFSRETFDGAEITSEDGNAWIVKLVTGEVTTIRKKFVTSYAE